MFAYNSCVILIFLVNIFSSTMTVATESNKNGSDPATIRFETYSGKRCQGTLVGARGERNYLVTVALCLDNVFTGGIPSAVEVIVHDDIVAETNRSKLKSKYNLAFVLINDRGLEPATLRLSDLQPNEPVIVKTVRDGRMIDFSYDLNESDLSASLVKLPTNDLGDSDAGAGMYDRDGLLIGVFVKCDNNFCYAIPLQKRNPLARAILNEASYSLEMDLSELEAVPETSVVEDPRQVPFSQEAAAEKFDLTKFFSTGPYVTNFPIAFFQKKYDRNASVEVTRDGDELKIRMEIDYVQKLTPGRIQDAEIFNSGAIIEFRCPIYEKVECRASSYIELGPSNKQRPDTALTAALDFLDSADGTTQPYLVFKSPAYAQSYHHLVRKSEANTLNRD